MKEKEYEWVVKHIFPEKLSYEQIKEIVNLKIARIILELENNRYETDFIY